MNVLAYLITGMCIGVSICIIIAIVAAREELKRVMRSTDPVARMVGAYALFLRKKNCELRSSVGILAHAERLKRTREIRKALAE